MDEFLQPENINVTIELTYSSTKDTQSRYIRSAIDFTSVHETSQKIISAILEDLCLIYGVPTMLATQMNIIIEEVEGNVKLFQ